MPWPEHLITVERTTDTGHRVVGHLGKCRFLHGHTYHYSVTVGSLELDSIGFVVDFGDLKAMIDEWDHRLILFHDDPFAKDYSDEEIGLFWGIVLVPFNPTVENMSKALYQKIKNNWPHLTYISVSIKETPTSEAVYSG